MSATTRPAVASAVAAPEPGQPVPPPLEEPTTMSGHGILEVVPEGFGFLRNPRLVAGVDDVYVAQSQIRRFSLRTGDMVEGTVRPPKEVERYPSPKLPSGVRSSNS